MNNNIDFKLVTSDQGKMQVTYFILMLISYLVLYSILLTYIMTSDSIPDKLKTALMITAILKTICFAWSFFLTRELFKHLFLYIKISHKMVILFTVFDSYYISYYFNDIKDVTKLLLKYIYLNAIFGFLIELYNYVAVLTEGCDCYYSYMTKSILINKYIYFDKIMSLLMCFTCYFLVYLIVIEVYFFIYYWDTFFVEYVGFTSADYKAFYSAFFITNLISHFASFYKKSQLNIFNLIGTCLAAYKSSEYDDRMINLVYSYIPIIIFHFILSFIKLFKDETMDENRYKDKFKINDEGIVEYIAM